MIVVLLITLAVVVSIVVLFATMPPTGCTGDCNQGRNCDCKKDSSVDRATVVVATLLLICIVSMGFGLYKLMHGTKGQDCAVEVQFAGGVKATYLGTSI